MALLSYALCSVEDVSRNMEITLTSPQDVLVENMINFLTKYAENYISRNIKVRDSDEIKYIDILSETEYIFLKNFPIQSITSVTEGGNELTEGVHSDYIEYAETGELVKPGGWAKGRKNVMVTYRGGYETVPEDIKQWCIDIAACMYREKDLGNMTSEDVGDISVEYGGVSKDEMTGYAKMKYLILDMYKSNDF